MIETRVIVFQNFKSLVHFIIRERIITTKGVRMLLDQAIKDLEKSTEPTELST